MSVLVASPRRAFYGGDIEFNFIDQCIQSILEKDSCKQFLALKWKLIQYPGL